MPPEVNKITVFNKGSPEKSNNLKPTGGHTPPNSISLTKLR